MTYIVTLTQDQFDRAYQILMQNGAPLDIINALDNAREHHHEREVVLRELLGIDVTHP